MKNENLKGFLEKLNLLCLQYEVKLVAGEAEREGLLLIESDTEFMGYSCHQTSYQETYIKELQCE